jgi:hypothetical protein
MTAAARSSASAAHAAGEATGPAFAATLVYVSIELIRPQDWVPGLAQIPLATLAAIPMTWFVVRHPRRAVLRDPLVLSMAAIVGFAFCWIPFATNNFWAFEMWKVLMLYGITLVALASFVDRPERLRALATVLFVAVVIQALWAVTHGGRGLSTHFQDENDLALGMAVALPFVVMGARHTRQWRMRLALIAASGLFAAAVVASASRGGLVAFGAAVAAIVLLGRRRLLIISVLAGGAILLAAAAPAEYWADMRTMFDPNDATRVERIRHWTDAFEIWKRNPVLGVGPGNIPWVVAEVEVFDDAVGRSLAGRAVHSLFFTLLPELGLLGTGLYVWLVVLIVRYGAAARGGDGRGGLDRASWARSLLGGLLALFTGGLFLSFLYYPHLYYLAGLALVMRHLDAGAPGAPGRPARRAWAAPLPAPSWGEVRAPIPIRSALGRGHR